MLRSNTKLVFHILGWHVTAAFGAGLLAGISMLWVTTWPLNNVPPNEPDAANTERLTRFEEAYPGSYLVGFPASRSSLDSTPANVALTGPASMLERVKPAVVRVLSSTLAGSGVVIDPSGIVLTSGHIPGDDEIVHVLIEEKEPLIGVVVQVDQARDLALVQLPLSASGGYDSAELGTENSVFLGAPVYAMGFPLNMLGPTSVTRGIVSRYYDEPDLGRQIIQTDAAINIGNSGGPILDEAGKVIGITTAILGDYPERRTVGISFAVSIATIRDHFLWVVPNAVAEWTQVPE